jgi:hypothetical protein
MGTEELPSSMAEKALGSLLGSDALTCLLVAGVIASLRADYNRASSKTTFFNEEPRPFGRTPRRYLLNEAIVLKKHSSSLFRALEIEPPPDSFFEIQFSGNPKAKYPQSPIEHACNSLLRICFDLRSMLGTSAIEKNELPSCWDISEGLPEHPIKDLRDLSEYLELRYSEIVAEIQMSASHGVTSGPTHRDVISFNNVVKSLSSMGFNELPPREAATDSLSSGRILRPHRIVHISGPPRHLSTERPMVRLTDFANLISWLRVERERQRVAVRRLDSIDQSQLPEMARVFEQMSSLVAQTNKASVATPKGDIAAEVMRNDYSPWIKVEVMTAVLFPLNNVTGRSDQTKRRTKERWQAENQPGSGNQTFRFRLSTLRTLGINYPPEWDNFAS